MKIKAVCFSILKSVIVIYAIISSLIVTGCIDGVYFKNWGITPPTIVTESFSTKYHDAKKILWRKATHNDISFFYLVKFRFSKKEMTAEFNTNGTWMQTETKIPLNQLPESIIKAFSKNYEAWTIKPKEIWKVEYPDDRLNYEFVAFERKRLDFLFIFSPEGKYFGRSRTNLWF